jgi:AAA domain
MSAPSFSLCLGMHDPTRPHYRSPLPLLEDSQGPFLFQQVDGTEEQTKSGSWQNVKEADEVVKWILKIKSKASQTNQRSWYSSNRVRIITFYQAQVNLINSKLAPHGFGTRNSGLLATTVDSSQGCESDLVIVSFVRTCHRTSGGARRIAGFLTDDRRINVALTRARYELICIGNAENMVANSEIGTLQALARHALSRVNGSDSKEEVPGDRSEDEATAKKRKKKEKRANETEEERRLRKQKKKEKKEKRAAEEAQKGNEGGGERKETSQKCY